MKNFGIASWELEFRPRSPQNVREHKNAICHIRMPFVNDGKDRTVCWVISNAYQTWVGLSCIIINHLCKNVCSLNVTPAVYISTCNTLQQAASCVSSNISNHVTLFYKLAKWEQSSGSPISNLWWMPNSISSGFDHATRKGSSRQFQQCPTTIYA